MCEKCEAIKAAVITTDIIKTKNLVPGYTPVPMVALHLPELHKLVCFDCGDVIEDITKGAITIYRNYTLDDETVVPLFAAVLHQECNNLIHTSYGRN